MADEACDILIVGGGVIGSAIACFVSRESPVSAGGPSVVVVEQDPSFARASTTLSAAGIRQQYSTPANIRMSQFGLDLLRHPERWFADPVDFAFKEQGYLLLASEAGRATLEANNKVQRNLGADIVLLGAAELNAQFPHISTDGIALAGFGQRGEGWFDNTGLHQAFRREARTNGVRMLTGTVTRLVRKGDVIVGADLAIGSRIAARAVVNAAGPLAGRLAATAGIALPVEPRKRSVFVLDLQDATGLESTPLTVDTSGVWVRPEGQYFIAGISPPAEADPPADGDFEVDHALFEETIWPALAHRMPAFETLKVVSSWAGHYAYNTLDQNAILGPHPEVANLLFANGFSGHGLQQSPAVGRGIAELLLHGCYRSLDLSVFGFDRMISGQAVRELNVI